ncbi:MULTISPECIES: type I secretion system permease/ATPase [Chelatococcus]|uniref:PrtD family type I secretion system ABC transporter n=1 Tax=Chelatococcus caeni TaxID=1348468 RepID=A0A840C274_9HYPH|nr:MULTISPECIES: type I secretion system permease/ATPase [Chelatococcus]MBB4018913.1 PrtD family type I secretion system ABC transporter [Chelatococcus caeni]
MQTRDPSALASAFRQIRPAFVAAGTLSLFMNLLMFVSPIYTLQIYDRVLTSRSGMTLVMISCIALVLLVSFAALEHFRSRILLHAGVQFDRLLAGESFEAALASASQTRGVHHVHILRDLDTLRDVFSGGMVTALMDAPWTPIFLGVCFLLHPLIGLVALVGGLAILALAFVNERVTKASLVAASLKNHQALDHLTATLRNADAIRGLGMAPQVRAAWAETRDEALHFGVRAGERGVTLLAISKFLRMAIQTGVMGVGAYLAIRQEISGGVLFAASLIMGRALAPIEGIVGQWRSFVAARTAHARLENTLKSQPARKKPMQLPRPTGAISVEGLTVVAPGGATPVVADVTLKLEPGEVVAIIGPTGSGKSSLARALVGAWSPVHGCVRLDGNDLRHFDPDQLGRALGYLPQDVELFAGSIRDNIARFRDDAPDEAVVEAAMLASTHAMIQRLPKGYQTEIGEDGAGLSGGQRQRIGLARALFGKPAFVVLDEPNANLDSDGDMALAQAIRNLRSEGVTIAIVTHRPNLLSIVDWIILMHEGRVARVGTRDELLPLLLGQNVAAAGPRRTAAGDSPAVQDERPPLASHRPAQAAGL